MMRRLTRRQTPDYRVNTQLDSHDKNRGTQNMHDPAGLLLARFFIWIVL
jgi:hypothetical protein